MIDIDPTQHQILYLSGDATQPSGRPAIIAHVCNDIGAWGRGFVLALSSRWPSVALSYRRYLLQLQRTSTPSLGTVDLVEIEPSLWVANMIAQHDIRHSGARPPIRYDALAQSLARLQVMASQRQASVHMPRIGCGLAGGRWGRVEPLIGEALCSHGIVVTVYDLPPQNTTVQR